MIEFTVFFFRFHLFPMFPITHAKTRQLSHSKANLTRKTPRKQGKGIE
jgi:hypothetical protein